MIGIFDLILILIWAGFVFYGFFFGLIRTIGALAGVVVGAFLASRFYLDAYAQTAGVFGNYENLGKIVVFIALFSLINWLTALIFSLLDKTFHLLSIIPFLKTFNRLGGALFGLLEGGLALGLVLYVASRYTLVGHWFGDWLASSQVAPILTKIAGLLIPLLPDMLKKLESVL